MVARKNAKHDIVYAQSRGTSEHMTLLCGASAAGVALPPMIIFAKSFPAGVHTDSTVPMIQCMEKVIVGGLIVNYSWLGWHLSLNSITPLFILFENSTNTFCVGDIKPIITRRTCTHVGSSKRLRLLGSSSGYLGKMRVHPNDVGVAKFYRKLLSTFSAVRPRYIADGPHGGNNRREYATKVVHFPIVSICIVATILL